jgi:hypothetical protein
MEPVDVVMVTHNRLDYLERTVDALFERTPEPIRLTLVDNASEPDVRTWIGERRDLFEHVVLLPRNEHQPAFQRGIELTSSDPFLVTDPDLVVPELEPSWLARLLDLLERHPDFGLVGLGLDPANRPPVLPPETLEPLVDGELVEAPVGTWFQAIRRDALRVPYTKDSHACRAVRAAGYRVGWAPGIRAFHLGWDDHLHYPAHLAAKHADPVTYTNYREVGLIARPPGLSELAQAAPVVAETRAAGVPDASVLELAWGQPLAGAALEDVVTVASPPLPLPLKDSAAGAVVLVDPPPGAIEEAARVASSVVVLVCDLEAVGGAAADELAPENWSGVERPGIGSLPLELARAGEGLEAMQGHRRYSTLEDRERWLRFFAAGSFGEGPRRLFVLRRERGSAPARVRGVERLERWRPPSPKPPGGGQRLRHEIAARLPEPVRRILRRLRG